MLINKLEEHKASKEDDQSPNSGKDKTSEDGSRKRTGSSTKKKDIQEPEKDLSDLKEATGRMIELEIWVAEILKEIA